jgi:hypothetical protein
MSIRTTYAVLRPGRTGNRDPLPVLVDEFKTLAEAEQIAAAGLSSWPHVWVEAWTDLGRGQRSEPARIVWRLHRRLVVA